MGIDLGYGFGQQKTLFRLDGDGFTGTGNRLFADHSAVNNYIFNIPNNQYIRNNFYRYIRENSYPISLGNNVNMFDLYAGNYLRNFFIIGNGYM